MTNPNHTLIALLIDRSGSMHSIKEVGDALEERDEDARPGKVIFLTLTDGMENSSREFTYDQIKEMITQQTKEYQWEFIFLGANIDAISVAQHMGIAKDSALTYGANAAGIESVFRSVSMCTSASRSGVASAAFSDKDRKEAMGLPS